MATGIYEITLEDGRLYEVEAPLDWDGQRWSRLLTGLKASRPAAPAAGAPQPPVPSPAAETAAAADQPLHGQAAVQAANPATEPPPPTSGATLSPAALDAIMLQWPGFGGTPGFPEPSTGDTARGQAGSAKIGWLSMRQISPAFQAMIEAGARETARRQGLPRDPSPEEMGLTQPSTKPEESQSLAPWRATPFQTTVEGKPDRAPLDVSPAVRKLAELEAAKRGVYRSEAQKRLAAATTTGQKFKAWIHDPVELTTSIMIESLPSSLAGGLIGAPAGPTGLAIGIGLSSFAATAAGELVGAAEKLDYNMSDPAQADAFFRSPEFADAASGVMQKAAVVGGIDAATSRVAGRWLGPAMSQGLRQRVGAVGKEMGLQMLGGGGGEALGALASGEAPDLFDVFSEVVAELPITEAATNVATQRQQATPAQGEQPAGGQKLQGGEQRPAGEPMTPGAAGMIKVHPIPTTTAEVRKAIEEAPTLQALADIVVDPGVKQLAAGLSPVENAGLTMLLDDRVAALEAAEARAETERAAIAATGAPSASGQGQGPMAATKEEAAGAVSPAREVLPPGAAPTVAAPAEALPAAEPKPAATPAGGPTALTTATTAGLTQGGTSQTVAPAAEGTITGPDARKGAEMPAEPKREPGPTAATSSTSQAATSRKSDRPPDLIDEIEGRIGAKLDPKLIREANPQWKPVGAARRLFRRGGQAAHVALDGLVREKAGFGIHEDLSLEEFGELINQAAQSRKGWRRSQAKEGRELNELGKQHVQFTQKVLKGERPKRDAGKVQVMPVNDLLEGDEFTVQGVKFEVAGVEYDEDGAALSVTLRDGQKFGIQDVDGTETIHIDKASLVSRPAPQQEAAEPAQQPFSLSRATESAAPAPDQRRIEAVAQIAREEGAKEGEFTVIWAPNWVLTDKDGRQFWVEGAPQDGRMILNAAVPTMANRANVRRVVREERTHLALISEEGRRLIRDFIGRYLTDGVRQQLAKQGYTRERYRSDEEYDQAVAEEFIAKQARENTQLWRRLVDLVRRWLAERGLANLTAEEAARGILSTIQKKGGTASEAQAGPGSVNDRAAILSNIEATEPVAITGEEVPRRGGVKAILEWAQKNLRSKVRHPVLGEILTDTRAIKNSLNHGYNRAKVAAVAVLPQLVERGVVAHRSSDPQGQMTILAAPVTIAGIPHRAFMLIRRDQNTQRLYVHEVVTMEKLREPSITGVGSQLTGAPGAIRSVAQSLYGVNAPGPMAQPSAAEPRQGPPGLSLTPVTSPQAPGTVSGAAPLATAQPGALGSAAPATATAGLPPLPVMDRETGRYVYPPATEQHRLAEELDSLNLWSLTPKPGPIGTTPGPHASNPNRSVFPIQLPEAVEFMATILGGKYPRLREKIRALKGRALGVAKFKGEEAEIELRRDLWALDTETIERLRQEAASFAKGTAQRDNLGPAMQGRLERERLDLLIKEEARNNPPTTALKTLWHEIGHIVDWLPDKTLGRGNIFGHIASLKKYLQPTLPMGPGIPHRPLTQDEKAGLRKQARRELEAEMGTWREIIERIKVEEPIYETLNITTDTIKAMFGMDAREQFPELYLWFASQPDEVKVQIVKAAMRGIVDPRVAAQGGQKIVGKRVVEQEVRRRVPAKGKPTQAEIVERFRKLLREEMDRRQQVDLETVKQELSDLIAWWRGTQKIEDYFKTAEEMYAEAYSVFMNNPAAVAARAPYYYRLIQNYMERKPEVAAEYNEIQDRLRAGTVMADRVRRLRDAWRKADEQALQWREESKSLSVKVSDFLDSVSYHLVRRFGPVFRRARRSGTPESVREAIGDYVYRATDHERFLSRVNHEVGVPLVAANLDWNDLGEYMFHKHITENRFVHDPVTGILRPIANPEGWTADTSMVRLAEMERELGPDRWAALVRAQEQFRRIYEAMVVGPMIQERMVSPELMRAITERVFYATFAAVQQQPQHTIEKLLDAAFGAGVGAGIYRQVGQLGHIKQPATATLLKAISLMTAIRRNRLAREIVELMLQVEPEMIKEAQWRWVNNRMEPVIEETAHVGTITFLKEGKLQAYYLPKLVADTMKFGNPTSLKPVVAMMRATSAMKGWLTQLNPAFWPVAAARDLIGWGMQLPGITAPIQYFKYMPGALRASYAYLRGRPNALADLAMDRRMKISRMAPTDYAEISNEYDMMLAGYGLDPAHWSKEANRLSLLRRFWEAWKAAGQISEFAHKIAGMNYLDANFPNMPEWKKQEIVRERAGSPDFLQRPAGSAYMDLALLFVNPWKEGLISLAKSAKENPWSFTAKTTAFVLAPTVLQAMAATGWLDDEVEEMYASISDYDLVNYLVVPLWWEDRAQRKVGYLRLPLWEPARIVHAALQRVLTGRGGGAQGISAQVAGSVPGLNPILDTALAWIQYEVMGVNPTDGYTGRPWLDDTTFQAGGWPARKELLKRSWGELGGSVIYRMRQSRPDDVDRTEMEKVLQAPGVQQLVGRWIKISNQGILDQDRQFGKGIAEHRANLRLASRQVVEKLVLHEPLSSGERQMMRDPYVMQYVRRALPEAVRNRSSLLQRRLARAQTREEKQRILKAEAALRSAPGPAPVGR